MDCDTVRFPDTIARMPMVELLKCIGVRVLQVFKVRIAPEW